MSITLIIIALIGVAAVAGVLVGVHNAVKIGKTQSNLQASVNQGLAVLETRIKTRVTSEVGALSTKVEAAHIKLDALKSKAEAAGATVAQTEKAVAQDVQAGAKQL